MTDTYRTTEKRFNGRCPACRTAFGEDPALERAVLDAQGTVARARKMLADALAEEQATLGRVAVRCRPARVCAPVGSDPHYGDV